MRDPYIVLFILAGFALQFLYLRETEAQKQEREEEERRQAAARAKAEEEEREQRREERARLEKLRQKHEAEEKRKLEEERERQRKERERLDKLRKQRQAEEKQKREEARKQFDDLVSPGIPYNIRSAHREFLAEKPLPRGQNWYGEDVSPLTFYGYRVGTTRGLRQHERQDIIRYVMRARLSDPLAKVYQRSWGHPLTRTRRSAICHHLSKLAAQRSSRKNYETAVAQWEADSKWAAEQFTDEIGKFDQYRFD